MRLARLAPLVTLAILGACAQDMPTAPRSPSLAAPSSPAALLGPDEAVRIISMVTDAFGNTVMVAEYAAGVYLDPTTPAAVASVTIKTSIPSVSSGSTKTPCITSTIVSIETTAGWTSSVRKPGGCDKPIEVALDNLSLNQKATFQFLYLFGKTRIDSGLIK
ncbi:MAG: hypothetical protein ABI625_11555 [bacterium]